MPGDRLRATCAPHVRAWGFVVTRPTRSLFWPRCRARLEIVFDGRGAANSVPFHLEVDPISSTIGLNGFYEADTWTMEFEVKALPFDPDQIAYAAVHIYMWDSQKHLEGSEWASTENLMVKGLVDDVETILVGEETIVKFTGRDYTALLSDAEWDPKHKIPSGRPLDLVVQDIADEAAPKGTRARFEVVWAGEADDAPIVGSMHRSTKKKGIWVKPGKSYWDVIWDLCIMHAYVARVEGSAIIISEPVTQTKQTLENAPRLVYGQHLMKLEIKRKFARESVPQIVIVSYDPDTGRKVETKFPEKRNADFKVTAQRDQPLDALGIPLTSKKDEQMYFPAPAGVTDQKALERYARMRFYHIGRGETIYAMGTKHLWLPDAKSPSREINMLALRPGAAIGVHFDPLNESFVRSIKEMGQRIDHITAMGYKPAVASFIAQNIERIELFKQNYYYNRGNIEFSIDEGIEIEIEAVNFAGEVQAIQFAERSGNV
jgi:hypothetical protein